MTGGKFVKERLDTGVVHRMQRVVEAHSGEKFNLYAALCDANDGLLSVTQEGVTCLRCQVLYARDGEVEP